MRVQGVFVRDRAQQTLFNRTHRFSPGESGTVGNAENMRIDGHRRFAEHAVQNDVRRFPADPGQRFQRGSIVWNLAVMHLE